MKKLVATALALGLAMPAFAHDFGFAGILDSKNEGEIPDITLSVGQPLVDQDGPVILKSGMKYELEIVSDGTGELALEGSGFFRAIWINEIVVNDLEIRPFGIESIEFDSAGTMEIEFIAIKPGQFYLRQPGTTGDARRVDIHIQ